MELIADEEVITAFNDNLIINDSAAGVYFNDSMNMNIRGNLSHSQLAQFSLPMISILAYCDRCFFARNCMRLGSTT